MNLKTRESGAEIERQRHDHCLRERRNKRKGWGWWKLAPKNKKKDKIKGDGTMNSKRNEGVILVGDGFLHNDGMVLGSD